MVCFSGDIILIGFLALVIFLILHIIESKGAIILIFLAIFLALFNIFLLGKVFLICSELILNQNWFKYGSLLSVIILIYKVDFLQRIAIGLINNVFIIQIFFLKILVNAHIINQSNKYIPSFGNENMGNVLLSIYISLSSLLSISILLFLLKYFGFDVNKYHAFFEAIGKLITETFYKLYIWGVSG